MLYFFYFGALFLNCRKEIRGVILMSCEEFLEDPYRLLDTQNKGKRGCLGIFVSFGSSRDIVFHNDRKTFPETHFENEKPNNSYTHKN